MVSKVDPNVPADRVPASKAEMRANWKAIKEEIETLQGHVGVASVFGQKGDVDLQSLPACPLPEADDCLPIQRADGSYATTRLSTIASGAEPFGGADAINVKEPRYGAVGDGKTDDRLAIQAALDAGKGKVILFPQGRYRISGPLFFPSDEHLGIRGIHRDLSQVVADPGYDVFRAKPHRGRNTTNRARGHFHFADLCIGFNNDDFGEKSNAFADRYHRCGILGEPIGPGGIVFEDRSPEGDFASPSEPRGVRWGQHSTFERLRFGPTSVNNAGISDFIAMYFSGHTYGSLFQNLLILNKTGFGIVETMPGVAAIEKIDTASRRILLRDGNPYLNGAEVIVVGVPTRTRPPQGLTLRTQKYFVVEGDGQSLSLAIEEQGRPIDLGFGATGQLYLMTSGRTAGEFAPDQNVYQLITCFCSQGGFSFVQQAKSKFDSMIAYGPSLYAFQHWAMPTSGSSRKWPNECSYINGYFEGPTSGDYDGADYVRLDGADSYGMLFPTEIAARNNHQDRPVVRVTGWRQSLSKISLKYASAAANSAHPILIVEGEHHEISGRCTKGTTIVDESKDSDLSRLRVV